MISVNFGFIWLSAFKRDDFLCFDQLETRVVNGHHIVPFSTVVSQGDCLMIQPIRNKKGANNFVKNLPQMILVKVGYIWPSDLREYDFFMFQTIRNKKGVNYIWD